MGKFPFFFPLFFPLLGTINWGHGLGFSEMGEKVGNFPFVKLMRLNIKNNEVKDGFNGLTWFENVWRFDDLTIWQFDDLTIWQFDIIDWIDVLNSLPIN